MTSAIFKKVLSRRLAVQALYQWQLNEQPIETVIEEFKGTSLFRNIDPEYFIYLLTNIGSNFDQLKEIVDKVSDLSWEQKRSTEITVDSWPMTAPACDRLRSGSSHGIARESPREPA